jgi:hypothetical protein
MSMLQLPNRAAPPEKETGSGAKPLSSEATAEQVSSQTWTVPVWVQVSASAVTVSVQV